MTTVEWKGNRVFEAQPPSGNRFLMDAYPEVGGQNMGPSPMEAFISAAAACSGIDVLLILEKKRQQLTSYSIEVEGTRAEDGPYPRPYTRLVFKHHLKGVNLDTGAVEQAIKLSDEKYCTAIATMRMSPDVSSVFDISEAA